MRAAILFVSLIVAVPDRQDPTPKSKPMTFQDQILGEWELARISVGGNAETPNKEDEKRVLRFTPSEIHVFVNGEMRPEDGATYTLDMSKNPVAIRFTPKNKNDNKTMQGLLKLEGGQLLLCIAIDGGRPADFVPNEKELQIVMYLNRPKR